MPLITIDVSDAAHATVNTVEVAANNLHNLLTTIATRTGNVPSEAITHAHNALDNVLHWTKVHVISVE
jgi:hypothetical protein